MEIHQRIKYLIELTCNGNQRLFAHKLDFNPQTVNNLLNRRSNPSFKMIQQILNAFPDINPHWLILGQGEIGLNLQATQYSNKSGFKTSLSEPQSEYQLASERQTLYTQRISALEREVQLLEKIIEEKDVLIGYLGKLNR